MAKLEISATSVLEQLKKVYPKACFNCDKNQVLALASLAKLAEQNSGAKIFLENSDAYIMAGVFDTYNSTSAPPPERVRQLLGIKIKNDN